MNNNCINCQSDKIKLSIYNYLICSLCGCIQNNNIYIIDSINNIEYTYSKKLWYKRINYVINIINHINGYINLDYIIQKAYDIVKNEIESENIIINYINIRKILKQNKFGT